MCLCATGDEKERPQRVVEKLVIDQCRANDGCLDSTNRHKVELGGLASGVEKKVQKVIDALWGCIVQLDEVECADRHICKCVVWVRDATGDGGESVAHRPTYAVDERLLRGHSRKSMSSAPKASVSQAALAGNRASKSIAEIWEISPKSHGGPIRHSIRFDSIRFAPPPRWLLAMVERLSLPESNFFFARCIPARCCRLI